MSSLVQRGFGVWLRVQEGMRRLFARPGVRFAVLALVFVGVTAYGVHEVLAQAGVTPPATPAATPPATPGAAAATTKPKAPTGPGITERILFVLAAILLPISTVIQTLILTVVDATIQIMQYNGFATSPVVSAGWAIVRDTVNMFFVIVLIYIAVRIMVGVGHFTIRQQVVPLLIFAIVVNFSKTICALIIDFGQVVMLTFANALKAVAAGNFIQLFGLDALSKVSGDSAIISSALEGAPVTASGAEFFGGALSAIIIGSIVLVTMVMLFAILAYRIVFLWVLIMLSPLAFFFGGARAAIGDKMYADWWQKFTCAVAIGPVITFFVWLTLAVAGAGNLASTEGFNSGLTTNNPVGGLLEIFDFNRLISFVMAIGMIFAGFEAANSVCGGASGTISGMLGTGRKFAGKAAALPFAAAGYVGSRVGRKGVELTRRGGAAGLQLATDLARTGAQKTPGLNRFTDVGARARVEAKLGTETDAKKRLKLQMEKDRLDKAIAGKQRGPGAAWGTMSDDAKVAKMQLLAAGGPSMIPGTKSEQQAEFVEMLKDKKVREKLDKTGDLKKLWDTMGHDAESALAGNPDAEHAIEGFEESRPDLTGKVSDIKTWEDVQKLDKTAFADEKVQAHLRQMDSGKVTKEGVPIKASELIEKGALGIDKQRNFKDGMAGVVGGMKDEDIANVPMDRLTAAVTVNTTGSDEEKRQSRERVDKLLRDKPAVARRLITSNAAGAQTALKDSGVYEAALKSIGMGAGGAVTNEDALKSALKENPALVGNFKETDLAGPAGAAIGNSLDDKKLTDLISRMKTATPDERAAMQPMIDGVTKALGEAAKGGNTGAVSQLTAFNKQAARTADRDIADVKVKIEANQAARGPVNQQRDAVRSQMTAKIQEIQGRGIDPALVNTVIEAETKGLATQLAAFDAKIKKMNDELAPLQQQSSVAQTRRDKARENSDEQIVQARLDREMQGPTP